MVIITIIDYINYNDMAPNFTIKFARVSSDFAAVCRP